MLAFRIEGERKKFSIDIKAKRLITTRLTLQDMLKGLL